MKRYLAVGGGTAGAIALLGPIVGFLWWWIVPRPETTVGPGGEPLPPDPSTVLFLDEAYFSVLGAVVGLLCGIGAYLAQYRVSAATGVDMRLAALIGMIAGSAIAAVLAWRLGVTLDTAAVERALAAADEGDTITMAVDLRAYGALLLWPFAAVLQYGVFDMVSILRGELGHENASADTE